MNKIWSDLAWDEYLQWQMLDKKTLKKINALIKVIERNGLSEGIGKPEPSQITLKKWQKYSFAMLDLAKRMGWK